VNIYESSIYKAVFLMAVIRKSFLSFSNDRFGLNVIPHELTGYGCLRSFWLRYRVLGIKNVFAMQYFCIFGVYYYVENN
ncbi:hypothetical protein, partial [Prevotella sp.]